MMPEAAAYRLLRILSPDRSDEGVPKFPARYSGCMISKSVRDRLQEIGFSQVWQVPFYGHDYYYRSIPVARDIHRRISDFLRARKVSRFASFAYTIALK